MNPQIASVIALATKDLSNIELAALNNVAQIGANPSGINCYEKVKHLFTEANGTKMHSEALDALAKIVNRRFQ